MTRTYKPMAYQLFREHQFEAGAKKILKKLLIILYSLNILLIIYLTLWRDFVNYVTVI